MAVQINSLRGITLDATITNANSGGTSGTAFDEDDTPQDTAGGTCTRSTTHSLPCMSVSLDVTSGPERRGWSVNAGASSTTQYYRAYLDPADFSGVVAVMRGMDDTSASQRWRLRLDTGVLTFRDSSNSAIWTSTQLAAGTLWRIELAVEGSASGAGRAWVYDTHATTASQDSGALSGQNFGGAIQSVWFGQGAAGTSLTGKLTWVGWSDTALLGPAVEGAIAASVPSLTMSASGQVQSPGADMRTVTYTGGGRLATTTIGGYL